MMKVTFVFSTGAMAASLLSFANPVNGMYLDSDKALHDREVQRLKAVEGSSRQAVYRCGEHRTEMKESEMKRQLGMIIFMGAAWFATTGAIGSVSAADFPIKDNALTDPARLDWASLSRDTQTPQLARLDWTGLSRQTELAQGDAPNAYIGTSFTETPAHDRLDWTGLSR